MAKNDLMGSAEKMLTEMMKEANKKESPLTFDDKIKLSKAVVELRKVAIIEERTKMGSGFDTQPGDTQDGDL